MFCQRLEARLTTKSIQISEQRQRIGRRKSPGKGLKEEAERKGKVVNSVCKLNMKHSHLTKKKKPLMKGGVIPYVP